MKLLMTYNYGDEAFKEIEEMGYEISYISENEITEDMKFEEVEVLVCYNPFEKLDISSMKNLKWIQVSSIGVDQVPTKEVLKRDIVVTNNRGGYSIPIGEFVVMRILEIMKNTKYFNSIQTNKRWRLTTDVLELYNKRVLILGTGTIGIEVAKRLKGFGVEIIGVNTNGKPVEFFDQTVSIRKLNDEVEKADILVLALPHTKDTDNILGEKILRSMKKDSSIINVSRGNLIDEVALVELLEEGYFRGVALDVFKEEPLSEESLLWELDRVYITPHNSWVSEKRNERRLELILQNLKRYVEKEELLNIVNIERGY